MSNAPDRPRATEMPPDTYCRVSNEDHSAFRALHDSLGEKTASLGPDTIPDAWLRADAFTSAADPSWQWGALANQALTAGHADIATDLLRRRGRCHVPAGLWQEFLAGSRDALEILVEHSHISRHAVSTSQPDTYPLWLEAARTPAQADLLLRLHIEHLDARRADGKTATIALATLCPRMALYLLGHGADPLAADEGGLTVLTSYLIARREGGANPTADAAVTAMVGAGVDLNAAYNGGLPLMLVTSLFQAKLLLAHGADPDRLDRHGRTPVHAWAATVRNIPSPINRAIFRHLVRRATTALTVKSALGLSVLDALRQGMVAPRNDAYARKMRSLVAYVEAVLSKRRAASLQKQEPVTQARRRSPGL